MLILTILALSFLLTVARHVGGSFVFPPAILCGTWLVSLIAILLSGDFMFPVRPEALAVYLLGCSSFTIGALCVVAWNGRPVSAGARPPPARSTLRAIDAVLAVLVVGLPYFWSMMTSGIEGAEGGMIFQAIRAAQIESSEQASAFSPVLNLNVLAQLGAVVAFYELDGTWSRRWRAGLAVALALVYGAMGGAKSPAVVILLTLLFVSALRAGRIRIGSLVATSGLAVGLFSLGLVAVNLADSGPADGATLVSKVGSVALLYWLGGLNSFGFVAANPDVLVATQPIDRFFLETARSLGVAVDVPPMHAEYTAIGFQAETNVYTIYFSYFTDFGWLGTAIIMALLGAVLTALYARAMRGGPVATMLYARLSVGLVLSLHAEHFFNGLNGLIKMFAFLALLYWLLPALRWRRTLARSHA